MSDEYPVMPPQPRKGRGAVENVAGRYERDAREAFDDGWGAADGAEELPPLRTTVTREAGKSILTRNESPDIPFRVSLNPYRGCEHGCVYCFARPTHSYLGLSPGLDFETRLFAKVNAAELLRTALSRKGYVTEALALGVNTDAYQPIERDWRITRQVVEVLHACHHPYMVITKSALMERDLDLMAPMARAGLVHATVTLTTLDPDLARKLEPRANSPARRLRLIRTLADAGVPVSVSVSPVIPFITDGEMETILAAVAGAGARGAHYIVLRLPWELNEVFQQWLQAHFPLRAERVMNRIRDLRGGADYDSRFGTRMRGEGVWADLFRQRFDKACARFGLNQKTRNADLDVTRFRPPADPAQPGLFDV